MGWLLLGGLLGRGMLRGGVLTSWWLLGCGMFGATIVGSVGSLLLARS